VGRSHSWIGKQVQIVGRELKDQVREIAFRYQYCMLNPRRLATNTAIAHAFHSRSVTN
jgi:hypothetical protein